MSQDVGPLIPLGIGFALGFGCGIGATIALAIRWLAGPRRP
jgi:hypothetical protein